MCGINGLISNNDLESTQLRISNGAQTQRHRGPDSHGQLVDKQGNWSVGLAHQRLSILDLSINGNQPMESDDGQYTLIYNGEIYNYRELRTELQQYGIKFKSDSDTEVIIYAIKLWGIEKSFSKFNGMWSLAILDNVNKKVFLGRDRFGVKPLYYSLTDNELLFASEIKAILQMSNNKYQLNYQVIGEYLLQSLVDTSEGTMFSNIKSMPAGHYGVVDLNNNDYLNLEIHQYYTFLFKEEKYSTDELFEYIRYLFFDSVKLRMRSDVPVGVLLSGGVDSSSIASAMKTIVGNEKINLLSAVSNDSRFDESKHIDIMSAYLGCATHKVLLDINPYNAFEMLEEVCWFNDHPVAGFASISQYLLMKRAHELGVTVILSGQGADEILCGYKKYLGFYLQYMLRNRNITEGIKVLSSFLSNGTVVNQFSYSEAKRYLPSIFQRNNLPQYNGKALEGYQPQILGLYPDSTVQQRQLLDVQKYSVPLIVHHEDRMSMAWSREVRDPFLDYRLVELFTNLPTSYKLSKGWTKYIFRKAMEPNLPPEIAWRKDKQGFVNPESEWLKKELKDSIINYFCPDSYIFKLNIVKREELLQLFAIYCQQDVNKGKVHYTNILAPLILEIWLRKNDRYISL